MKTIKLSEWCKLKGISYRTGHRWFHSNKIDGAYQTPSGTILNWAFEDIKDNKGFKK